MTDKSTWEIDDAMDVDMGTSNSFMIDDIKYGRYNRTCAMSVVSDSGIDGNFVIGKETDNTIYRSW